MIPPTLSEIAALWIITNVVLAFFIGFRRIAAFNIGITVLIILCIVAGFFMSFGNELYLWIFYPQG